MQLVLERPEGAVWAKFPTFFSQWDYEISGNQGLLNRELCARFLKWLVGMYVMYFILPTHPTPETILIVEIIPVQ